jgi:hypothetical protein
LEASVVLFGGSETQSAQVCLEGFAQRPSLLVAVVVSIEVFYRSYDAIGSGLVILVQPTKHAGRVDYSRIANAILDLMPGGISPQTLLASRPEIFFGI